MIDLNLPPPVEEETTLQRQESIDLNKRLSNSPIIHKNLYPLTPSLGQVSSDTQNIQREASFFEMPNVKPPLKRKLYGTRDEAWKNQIRKTLLLKRLRKKEGSMFVSKEKSMTAPVKKTKAVRGSIEWRKNVGKGVQSFYHGLSSEALEERRRLRKERKSRKLSTRKHHIYGGNS